MILEELIVLTRGTCESITARKHEARMEVRVDGTNLLLAASPEFWTSLSTADIFEDDERVLVHRYSILGLHFAAALGELTVRGETCWSRAAGGSTGDGREGEGMSASSTCIVDFTDGIEFLSSQEQQDDFEELVEQLEHKYEFEIR